MPTHRVMKAVLWNFLGTFTSRYSDFEGYWLFGFLVEDLVALRIDLLVPGAGEPDSPLRAAMHAAPARFDEQLRKAAFDRARLLSASLTMRKRPEPVAIAECAQQRTGHRVTFVATAAIRGGHNYERELSILVAPHDPRIESRSGSGRPTMPT